MQAQEPDEKRESERAPLDIYMNKFILGIPYLTRASDISEQGLGLAQLLEPSSAERRVGLQFQLPGFDEVIYAEGEVVREWGDEAMPRSGIRFLRLTERHRRMIDAYVQDLQSLQRPLESRATS